MSLNNPQNNPVNNPLSATDKTVTSDGASILEPENVMSIQRTVVAEANAVLASNRKRDPVVTLMPDGTQRIDF
ncbi:MAG: hypothetical protein AB7T49_20790 [Oligoflexales bacterium]